MITAAPSSGIAVRCNKIPIRVVLVQRCGAHAVVVRAVVCDALRQLGTVDYNGGSAADPSLSSWQDYPLKTRHSR